MKNITQFSQTADTDMELECNRVHFYRRYRPYILINFQCILITDTHSTDVLSSTIFVSTKVGRIMSRLIATDICLPQLSTVVQLTTLSMM